jgi:hypothetical protein
MHCNRGAPPTAGATQCLLLESAKLICFDLAWPLANLRMRTGSGFTTAHGAATR